MPALTILVEFSFECVIVTKLEQFTSTNFVFNCNVLVNLDTCTSTLFINIVKMKSDMINVKECLPEQMLGTNTAG